MSWELGEAGTPSDCSAIFEKSGRSWGRGEGGEGEEFGGGVKSDRLTCTRGDIYYAVTRCQ